MRKAVEKWIAREWLGPGLLELSERATGLRKEIRTPSKKKKRRKPLIFTTLI
jgi:hypothetical protein